MEYVMSREEKEFLRKYELPEKFYRSENGIEVTKIDRRAHEKESVR